jgi:hypothetical protein
VPEARFLPRWEVGDVTGAVVAVDVIRAFTTAAYAFAAGAKHIYLVDSVEEALAVKRAEPDVVLMGEDHGRRPPGFDFSNSPVAIAVCWCSARLLEPVAWSLRVAPPDCGAPAWCAPRPRPRQSLRAVWDRRPT